MLPILKEYDSHFSARSGRAGRDLHLLVINWGLLILALIFLLVAIGMTTPPVRADNAPPGSYRQSCRNWNATGTTLTAECKNNNGAWQPLSTLMNFDQCIGDIQNLNGNLQCNKGAGTPPGSYRQSCRDIYVNGTTLYAACKDNNGAWQPQSILTDIQQCTGDIQNLNGKLECNKGGTTPPGSYQQSCRDIYVNGTTLYATCKTSNGAWSSTPTSLSNVNQCIGGILNINGVLRCSMGEAPPNGSYKQSCTDEWVSDNTLYATCGDGTDRPWSATQLANLSACRGDITNIVGVLSCPMGTGNPPPGNYVQTCWQVQVNGTSMTATCLARSPNRVTHMSTLATINTCTSPVSNIDGFLSCNRGPQTPPLGSYQKTCVNPSFNGTTLTADCETLGGTLAPNPSSVTNITNCSDIANQNGKLVCITAQSQPQITAWLTGSGASTVLHISGTKFAANSSVAVYIEEATPPYQRIAYAPSPITTNGQGSFGPVSIPFNCPQLPITVFAAGGNQESNIVPLKCN